MLKETVRANMLLLASINAAVPHVPMIGAVFRRFVHHRETLRGVKRLHIEDQSGRKNNVCSPYSDNIIDRMCTENILIQFRAQLANT